MTLTRRAAQLPLKPIMRFFGVILMIVLAAPFPVAAQKGQQIFDLFLQGAQQEMLRQQQLEHNRQQQKMLQRMHQQFVARWDACHGGDVAACDDALGYPYLAVQDRQSLMGRRARIIADRQAAAERARQERIEAEVLAHRQRIAAERARARARELEDQRGRSADLPLATALQPTQSTIRQTTLGALLFEWPPTALSGSMMTALAFAAGLLLFQSLRPRQDVSPAAPRATAARPNPSSAAPTKPPPIPKAPRPPPPPVPTSRDTAGAIAALELALAYIEEVRDTPRPAIDDKVERKQQLNTLALAAKQLDLAQRLDPDAMLETESDGVPLRWAINELKAEALVLEGITHQVFDIRRAIPALAAATELDPQSARAFYILGLTHAANMSRAKAVAAFERAVALEPMNIAYRKELDRAQNMSAAEMAAYHATRTAEKVVDNAVMTWNVFAITWNILTLPLRLLFRLFRLLRLHPFT